MNDKFCKHGKKHESVKIDDFESPLIVGIMFSNDCNLNCKYCIARNGKGYSKTNLLSDRIYELFDVVKHSSMRGLLLSGGEPTLNPALSIFLNLTKELDIFVMLDTNGTNLNDDLLDTISGDNNIIPRISLDSNIKEIHNKNRGYFDETSQNITRLLRVKNNLRINTVLSKSNIFHMKETADYLISLGIKKWHIYKLQHLFAPKSLWITDEEAKVCISLLQEKYSQDISISCKYTSNNDGYASFMIDGLGSCFSTDLYGKKVVWGNIFACSIDSIWMNTPYEYRSRHIHKYAKI